MTWRYAITREQVDGVNGLEDLYTIREVYAREDDFSDTDLLGWTKDPIAARGDTWKECVNDLALMSRAGNAPILDLTFDPPRWVDPIELRRTERAEREGREESQ